MTHPVRWKTFPLFGALTGLVAAAAALGVAELVAATSKTLQSPVLDVGDRVVDLAPRPMKDLAIRWFGTNDKIALLVGIGVLLAIYAMVVGVLALRTRLWPALVGIGAFGLIGAVSAVTTRRRAPLTAMIPSVVGTAVAAAVLWWLHRLAHRQVADQVANRQPADQPSIADQVPNDRRRFLFAVGATGVAASVVGVVGRSLKGSGEAAASRNNLALPTPQVRLATPTAAMSAEGAVPFFTPNASFYRIDTAITVPQVPTRRLATVDQGDGRSSR